MTGLEVSVSHLDSRLTHIESKLDSQFEAMRRAIVDLNDRFSQTRQTSWGVLAAWAAVVVSIVGIVGASYVRDIDRTTRQVEEIKDDFERHVGDGHPHSVLARMDALENARRREEELRSREADLRDAEYRRSIDALARRVLELERQR